nr:hypothetical protein [Tanacetum cinerariifolium]
MRENDKAEKVKHEMDEIETINIELEHSVAKLLYKNEHLLKEIEHLKKIYKDQFDSIRKRHALFKEHCDSLIAQLNSKSMEYVDLKGQVQEKVFVTTTLQSELKRLKGKHVLDNAVIITNATTITPGMFKLDIEPLSHILKNNRDAHEDYLKKTKENNDTIRGLAERARKRNPSKPLLDSAYFGKRFILQQELSDEQAFWLQTSHPNTDQSASSPVKIESLKELPKEHIKSMRENDKAEKVKHEMDEIETINIELEHSVAKLLYKNEHLLKEIEHLKKIYKDQFDSIRKRHALFKEHCDSLIAQLNSKSMEYVDLKGQVQEKVFVTTTLQSELKRLKGKHVLDNAVIITNATTITPGMFKLDIEPLSHILKNNRDAHEDYLKKTKENNDTIRGLAERARKRNPSKLLLDSACKFTKHIKELLVYASQTCLSFTNLVRVWITPTKVVQFKETTSNSGETQKPKNKVYSRRPKQVKLVASSKKAKIVESKIVNNSEPTHLWGSNDTNVSSSSSLVNDRGYGDYQLGNVIISRVYYVEGLRHNLFSVGKFCNADLEVAFQKNTFFIQNLEGTLNKLAKDGLARGIPKLKFQKDHLCSACAFRKSKKSSHQPKAEDTDQEKLYLLHMDLCGPMCVESINEKNSGPRLQLINPATSNLVLVPNPIPQQHCTPPKRDDLDRLFQTMFDEYVNPLTIAVSPVSVTAAQRAVDIADSPVSTSIDQDAPSTSIPSIQEQEYSLIISQGVDESPKIPHFHDAPLYEFL